MGSAVDKEKILKELREAIEKGEVDEEVIPILNSINSLESLVTTSSCAGRIQLIEVGELGDKEGSRWIGKYHSWPGVETLIEDITTWRGEGFLLLQCQSPIFHVRSRDIKRATWLLNLAREAGFKYSGIRSIRLDKKGGIVEFSVVVELLTPNRLDLPLGRCGTLYISEEELRALLPLFKGCLERGKASLRRLRELLEEHLDRGTPLPL